MFETKQSNDRAQFSNYIWSEDKDVKVRGCYREKVRSKPSPLFCRLFQLVCSVAYFEEKFMVGHLRIQF